MTPKHYIIMLTFEKIIKICFNFSLPGQKPGPQGDTSRAVPDGRGVQDRVPGEGFVRGQAPDWSTRGQDEVIGGGHEGGRGQEEVARGTGRRT